MLRLLSPPQMILGLIPEFSFCGSLFTKNQLAQRGMMKTLGTEEKLAPNGLTGSDGLADWFFYRCLKTLALPPNTTVASA